MMKYFEKFFPFINYDGDFCRDIFKIFRFQENGLDNNILENYSIKNGQTLQSISLELYDSQDFWFTIAIVNNIEDPFYDFPRNTQSLFQHVLKVNGGVYDNRIYERILIDNRDKMSIKVVKKDYINQFVADLATALE